jgi:hypothetical protein
MGKIVAASLKAYAMYAAAVLPSIVFIFFAIRGLLKKTKLVKKTAAEGEKSGSARLFWDDHTLNNFNLHHLNSPVQIFFRSRHARLKKQHKETPRTKSAPRRHIRTLKMLWQPTA